MAGRDTNHPSRPKPGPEPERLKLDREDWGETVKEALKKPPPPKSKSPRKPRRRKG